MKIIISQYLCYVTSSTAAAAAATTTATITTTTTIITTARLLLLTQQEDNVNWIQTLCDKMRHRELMQDKAETTSDTAEITDRQTTYYTLHSGNKNNIIQIYQS